MSGVVAKPPAGLAAAGKALWKAILADVGEGWELDARDLDLLAGACRCDDRIRELNAVVKRDGLMVTGSQGQLVMHPAVGEVRQLELAKLRLLGAIELSDPKAPGASSTPAIERARKAGHARWARQARAGAMRSG